MARILPERGFMVVPIDGGPVRFMTYHQYIDSPEWKARVKVMKEAAGWTCQDCGSSEHITGHHRHYLNLGRERPEDIEVLCWDCHQTRHS